MMTGENRIAKLEAQVARLTALLETNGPPAPDQAGDVAKGGSHNGSTSRRQLLKLAGAAAVGVTGASLAAAPPAGASTGTMMFGAINDAGTDSTELDSTNNLGTFVATNAGGGPALEATDQGTGTGRALLAVLGNSANGSDGITARNNGDGYTIHAEHNSTTATNAAIGGFHQGPGSGVYGQSAAGAGVNGNSTGNTVGCYGLQGAGGLAPLFLQPAATPGPPTSGSHLPGELFVDSVAALFTCVAAGTPGTWVRVGLNPLSPTRILDTRNGTGGITGPLGPGQTVDLVVGGNNGVPAAASAVVMNATVTDTDASSFLTIFPKGAGQPTASNLNWAAAETTPNLVTVKLGTGGAISIFNDLGHVQVILDLAGFYS